MSKLARVSQKQFGTSGLVGDFGVFGSLAAGNKTFSQDPTLIQSLAAFSTGWGAAVVGNYEPPLEDMNSLFLLLFRQLCYMFQEGISEWDTGTIYYVGSLVKVNGQLYNSVVDNNTGNNPSTDSGNNWQPGIGGNSGGVPTGAMLPYAGSSIAIPTGYLLCDGTAVARTTYPQLFTKIGTSYGAGDGTTTFNLPSSKGRVLVGADGTVEFSGPGQLGGEKYHTLTINEMPSHNHNLIDWSTTGPGLWPAGNGNNPNTTWPTDSTGGNQPHNNIQPYLVIGGMIIKY